MGILDWLLSDPTRSDGGFLAALLNGGRFADDGAAGSAPSYPGSSSLLSESPLINLLRSGFAGMNAADGYSGFGPQFAAGVAGGADAMARRRQQMVQDRLDGLALNRAMAQQGSGGAAAQGLAGSGPEQPSSGACTGGCGGRKPPAEPVPVREAGDNAFANAASPVVGATPSVPVKVDTPQDAARLPAGTWFLTPDGRVLRRGLADGS